ncbi:hypothetical protein DRP05_01985 [Archaeoglobales archaeon]|nr:MAG: hypothetical protein DRP05_01985 [Archaeoglobales archaeon]
MFLVVLIVLINSSQVSAFEAVPANVSDEELMKQVKNDPPDEVKISFWDLPLWIKIHHLITIAAGRTGFI